MYATAIYAVLDAGRGTLRLSSAGHPPTVPPPAWRARHSPTGRSDDVLDLG